jgi:hybrid cluster-associated redox disulfide protein
MLLKGGATMEVTKDTLNSELFDNYPQTAKAFVQNNLCCIACNEQMYDSLDQAASKHSMDIDILMKDIFAIIN